MISNDRIIACVYTTLGGSFNENDGDVAAYLMSEFTWSREGTLSKIKEHLKEGIENNGRILKHFSVGTGYRIFNVDSLKRAFYLFDKYEKIKKHEEKNYRIIK